MIVKELKETLKEIPDDAKVFIQCDHGQNIESAYYIEPSRSVNTDCIEEMIFEYENWKECYDEDSVEKYDENSKITAVLIESF